MGHLMHKPCLYTDEATLWLMAQSKSALADMLTEVLRLDSDCFDDEATAHAAEERFSRVLTLRKQLRGLSKAMQAEDEASRSRNLT